MIHAPLLFAKIIFYMCSIQEHWKRSSKWRAASINSKQQQTTVYKQQQRQLAAVAAAAAATVAAVSIAAEVVAVGSSKKQQLLPVNWINLTNKSQVFNNLAMQ